MQEQKHLEESRMQTKEITNLENELKMQKMMKFLINEKESESKRESSTKENDQIYDNETTIFIRNIPYSATAKELDDFLNETIGEVRDVRILSTNFRGKLTSRGIGFADFKSPESFTKALLVQNIEFQGDN